MIRDFTSIDGQSIPLDWSPEKGYPKELPNSFYPRAAQGDGMSDGLTLILDGDIDNYYCSSTNGPGFKVYNKNLITQILYLSSSHTGRLSQSHRYTTC